MQKVLSSQPLRNLVQAVFFATTLNSSIQVLAQGSSLAPETEKEIDALVVKALADGSTPSVSIAIVKDGKIAFAKA